VRAPAYPGYPGSKGIEMIVRSYIDGVTLLYYYYIIVLYVAGADSSEDEAGDDGTVECQTTQVGHGQKHHQPGQ